MTELNLFRPFSGFPRLLSGSFPGGDSLPAFSQWKGCEPVVGTTR